MAMLRARAGSRPFILSHLVTGRCNARCPTCLWKDPHTTELDTEDILWLYGQAGAQGMAQVVLWGGEPLLREDISAVAAGARRVGLVTTLITNGWLLPERWPALRGWVDALILSLDDVGEAHDRLRGVPGLYDRLQEFVEELAHDPLRPTLIMNTVLSRLNRGALRRVAPVAARWRAGLYFCPMETGQMQSAGFDPSAAAFALPPDELREAALLARELKAAGYPLLATDDYLELLLHDPQLTRYACRAPRAILTVEADGAVRDCLRRDEPIVRVSDLRCAGRGLGLVFDHPRYQEMLAESACCNACNNPDAIEMSWLWDLRPTMLEKAVRLVRSQRPGRYGSVF